ncbi:MAG: hypothetical protein HYU63_03480 [Armatimonadetes bacterium]|nr:hypothetical protein [Armatimonadota bacterium]
MSNTLNPNSQIKGNIDDQNALRISREYYKIRRYLTENPEAKEIPGELIGTKGTLQIKVLEKERDSNSLKPIPRSFIVSKEAKNEKDAWQSLYTKGNKYQGVMGRLSGENSISKQFINGKGESKVVDVVTNYAGTESKLMRAKNLPQLSLKKAKNGMFIIKKDPLKPVIKEKYEDPQRIVYKSELVFDFVRDNPKVSRMPDPNGGKGTVEILSRKKNPETGIEEVIIQKVSLDGKKGWKEVYTKHRRNLGSLSETCTILEHISTDPKKSRQAVIFTPDLKWQKSPRVSFTPLQDRYLIPDSQKPGKLIEPTVMKAYNR